MIAELSEWLDLTRFGEYAMLIFFGVFVAICIRTALTATTTMNDSAHLPLTDDEASKYE